MDEIVYSALSNYYNALEKVGYMSSKQVHKLLVLIFYIDFINNDYRGYITKEDYHSIEKALNCLYGTTCLIPYPDYLKMGKLNLGALTEIAQRVKSLEETAVLKLMDATSTDTDSDVIVLTDEEDE